MGACHVPPAVGRECGGWPSGAPPSARDAGTLPRSTGRGSGGLGSGRAGWVGWHQPVPARCSAASRLYRKSGLRLPVFPPSTTPPRLAAPGPLCNTVVCAGGTRPAGSGTAAGCAARRTCASTRPPRLYRLTEGCATARCEPRWARCACRARCARFASQDPLGAATCLLPRCFPAPCQAQARQQAWRALCTRAVSERCALAACAAAAAWRRCLIDFRPRSFPAEQYQLLVHLAEAVVRELEGASLLRFRQMALEETRCGVRRLVRGLGCFSGAPCCCTGPSPAALRWACAWAGSAALCCRSPGGLLAGGPQRWASFLSPVVRPAGNLAGWGQAHVTMLP